MTDKINERIVRIKEQIIDTKIIRHKLGLNDYDEIIDDFESLITTIESLQSKNEQYETTVTHQQEAFKDQGKEILQCRSELESQKEEITQLREELNAVRPLVDLGLQDKNDLIESLQKENERYKQVLMPSVVYSAIRHYYKQGLFESDEYGDIENIMDLISHLQEGEKP